MSRKRDTNWSRGEITTLLDSIIEFTKTRAADSKKTNSREIFEYAARKMGEKGHHSRAQREKCRTKWKKMKEEFTQAKRAKEGDTRFKEAPGIQPFYERMEEFINGNFDNISPHSTIVRRTSSLSSSGGRSSLGSSSTTRTSARIAANSTSAPNGNSATISSTDNATNPNETLLIKPTNVNDYSSPPRQNSRLQSTPTSNAVAANNNSSINNHIQASLIVPNQQQHQTDNLHQSITGDQLCTYPNYTGGFSNNVPATTASSNVSLLNPGNDINLPNHSASDGHADISYRVSSGCRQITIFGDHDVDIKFRGDCVTINKINVDYQLQDT